METEVTVQVFEEEQKAIEHLQNLGFETISQFYLIDNYFSKHSLNKLRKMKYKNIIASSFLIRHFEGAKGDKTQLLYKNKVVKNDVVLMEEKIVSNLDSKTSTFEIFKHAGLNNWCNVNQHLTILEKEGFQFALQNVENLGLFIEYEEDESVEGLSAEQKIKVMIEKLSTLGFKLGEDYGCKKPFMILHKN